MNLVKTIKFILIGLILVFSFNLLLPVLAHAQDEGSVPEIKKEMEQFGQTTPVAKSEPEIFVGNIIKSVIAVIGVILIAMIIYGGLTYATASGNQEKTETAKKILVYAIIGVVIIALAYALTDIIIRALFDFRANDFEKTKQQ